MDLRSSGSVTASFPTGVHDVGKCREVLSGNAEH